MNMNTLKLLLKIYSSFSHAYMENELINNPVWLTFGFYFSVFYKNAQNGADQLFLFFYFYYLAETSRVEKSSIMFSISKISHEVRCCGHRKWSARP